MPPSLLRVSRQVSFDRKAQLIDAVYDVVPVRLFDFGDFDVVTTVVSDFDVDLQVSVHVSHPLCFEATAKTFDLSRGQICKHYVIQKTVFAIYVFVFDFFEFGRRTLGV